jgi:fatty acid-binding protein DegV
LIPRLEQEGNRPGELLSRHNARWTAEQIVFVCNDLQALVKGGSDYVAALYNRHRALGRLYS